MSVQDQIEAELAKHLQKLPSRIAAAGLNPNDLTLRSHVGAEFLTGASQVIRWLIANEGSEKLTPQLIERALAAVGEKQGFKVN